MRLNDVELATMLEDLKSNLQPKTLCTELQTTIKHLPTYNKIIKTHINQLQTVLGLDNHNNKNMENINLAPTITQLINIFAQLEEDDLEQLEQLYAAAISWNSHQSMPTTSTISEMTT